jgi:hypothetical protein
MGRPRTAFAFFFTLFFRSAFRVAFRLPAAGLVCFAIGYLLFL